MVRSIPAEPGSREAGEHPLVVTAALHGGPREGGTTAGSAPVIPSSAFPRVGGSATSAAQAAMTPGPWWLVLWMPLLATLPAGAVQEEEEEAVMAGNPGSGRGGLPSGRQGHAWARPVPAPVCDHPDASRFNSFTTHCRAPAQLAPCHQL